MIILSNKFGQLANRIFLFSYLINFSMRHNVTFYNPSFDEYTPFFEGTTNGLMIRNRKTNHFFDSNNILRGLAYIFFKACSKILTSTPFINIFFKKKFLKNGEFFSLDHLENIQLFTSKRIFFLSGWLFRSNDFDVECHAFIKKYFAPIKQHTENIKKIINPIREKHDIVIGIHIRRGDYRVYSEGIYFYSIEGYFRFMLSLTDIFNTGNIAFLVCSNEKIDLGIFKGLNVFSGSGHFVEDLYSLSECDYIAGPPSTYSMWASYYGNKPLYMINNINETPEKKSFQITKL